MLLEPLSLLSNLGPPLLESFSIAILSQRRKDTWDIVACPVQYLLDWHIAAAHDGSCLGRDARNGRRPLSHL